MENVPIRGEGGSGSRQWWEKMDQRAFHSAKNLISPHLAFAMLVTTEEEHRNLELPLRKTVWSGI